MLSSWMGKHLTARKAASERQIDIFSYEHRSSHQLWPIVPHVTHLAIGFEHLHLHLIRFGRSEQMRAAGALSLPGPATCRNAEGAGYTAGADGLGLCGIAI
jgi:hypothetical protein